VRNIGASGQFVALGIDSLLVLGTDGALLAAVLGLLLVIEPIGSLIALTTLGLLGFTFHSATKKNIEKWGYRRTHLEAKRLQYLQEGFGAIKELKALETEEYFASRIESELGETTSLSRKFVTLSSLPRIWLELLAFIGLAFLIIILTARGETLVNSLPILTVFTAAAFRLMPLVNRIIFAVQNLRFGRAAAEILRAEPIDQVESNQYHVNKIRSMKSHIELDDVTYVYPSAFSPVVEKASLFIPKGEIVGIIGESGSGKSTIANLILGLLQPTSGSVKIDGRDVDKSEIPIGRLIGYVPQSIFMIDETIRKNIAFGVSDEDIDEMRIESAIKQSSLTDVISQLPAGLDTKVGEDGAKLSGGQLQRIGIARALYNNPSVLLLDEATSSLDPFTESEIIEELRSMKGAKTVILITHRASTLSICDVIYRMEFGRLHRTGENSRI
jgi:ABC-type bacteriocin/lantibiotic exporter with double-glycine peptidase domain